MSKTPVVLIHSGAGADLEKFYNGVKEMLNAKYHAPGNSFPNYTISEKELTEIASLSSHAAHASDNLHVGGVHIERLIT